MEKQIFEDEFVSLFIENGIVFCTYKTDRIDFTAAKQSVLLRKKAVQNVSYPFFVDISAIKSVAKNARDFLATEEAIENISAAALLSGSFLSKTIGTFFLTFNNPGIPVKLFTDKQEAIKWLGKYVNKS